MPFGLTIKDPAFLGGGEGNSRCAITHLLADNAAVEVGAREYIRLQSDSASAGTRTFTLTAGNKCGQLILLEWVGANAGNLVNGSALTGSSGIVRLTADWDPVAYDTLLLAYNGLDLIEVGRNSGGGAPPSGANPTASVGLAAVNGSAGTFLRSDGAPALSQSIAPTWTGQHTFNNGGAGVLVKLSNLTAAVDGAQQDSPVLNFVGQAWRDDTDVSVTQQVFVSAKGIQVTGGRPKSELTVDMRVEGVDLTAFRVSWSPSYNEFPNLSFGDRANPLATGAAQGFLYLPGMAGTPSGTPLNEGTYLYPLTLDVTNNRLYAYNSGWQNLTPSAASGANPTASVGLAAVNGVASTYMRSDAAPPLAPELAAPGKLFNAWNFS